ncbi:MAG: hypothetical protein L0219_16375 [Phycisphaerales bacterium]|nr:hypothetical protein [Phycisphaerales bacterium]
MTIALIIAVFWLAYSNGANDNFKGVATLYGSGEASFARARLWATVTTIAGSLVSIVLAASLAYADDPDAIPIRLPPRGVHE